MVSSAAVLSNKRQSPSGSLKSVSRSSALSSSSNSVAPGSSVRGLRPGAPIKAPSTRDADWFQSQPVSGAPLRRSQPRSGRPWASGWPVYQVGRSGSHWRRKASSVAVKRSSEASALDQSIQVVELSWQ